MTTLETTLDQILVFMKSNQSQSVNTNPDNTSEAATKEVTTVTTPTLLERGVGE